MDWDDALFIGAFVITVGVLMAFLGNSITGYMAGSVYCDEEQCTNFCKSDVDCPKGLLCCQKHDFGICQDQCDVPYVHTKDVDVSKLPYMEGPARHGDPIVMYSVLLFSVFFVGIMYMMIKGLN